MKDLHLDPLFEFSNAIERYGYKDVEKQACLDRGEKRKISYKSNGRSFFREQIWCRITVLAQSVILLLVHVGKQSIRLGTCLISGCIQTETSLLLVVVKDVISLPINCVALPILGLVATFVPQAAAFMAKRIEKWLNNDSFQSPGIWQVSQYVGSFNTKGVRAVCATLVMRATAEVQLVLAAVQRVFTEFLNPCVFDETVNVVTAPFQLLTAAFSVLFTDKYQEAHGLLPR